VADTTAKTIELTELEAQVIGVSLAIAHQLVGGNIGGAVALIPVGNRFFSRQSAEQADVLARKINTVSDLFEV
jgi:hypothetical protein